MTKEEFLEFIKTDEGKAALEAEKKPLEDKNQELLDEAKAAKTAASDLKATEDERIAEAAKVKTDAEAARLKDSNDFDAYKEFHENEIAKRDTEVSELKNMFAKTEMDRLIVEKASANSQNPKPLQYLLRDRVAAEYDDNGKLSITVNGDDGKPMYHEGQPATIDQLVDSLKADESNATFFSASGSSGSGTSANDGNAPATGNYKDMDSDDYNMTKAMGNKI